MEKLLRYFGRDLQDIYLEDWLKQKPEALGPIAAKWFAIIKNCGKDVQDIFHDNYPIGCVENAPFAYVNVFKEHVNVGFFYGTGKRMRHVKLRPNQTHDDKAITSLIQAANSDIKERLD